MNFNKRDEYAKVFQGKSHRAASRQYGREKPQTHLFNESLHTDPAMNMSDSIDLSLGCDSETNDSRCLPQGTDGGEALLDWFRRGGVVDRSISWCHGDRIRLFYCTTSFGDEIVRGWLRADEKGHVDCQALESADAEQNTFGRAGGSRFVTDDEVPFIISSTIK